MIRASAFLFFLILAGCAHIRAQEAATRDPQAAYHVARIAEGAYLASGQVRAETLERLARLDRAAREALARWQEQPNQENALAAGTRVADLQDYLLTEARF